MRTGTFYWETEEYHHDNSFTLNDWLENQMQDDVDIIYKDGGILEALKFYCAEVGGEIQEIDSIVEIPQEKWKTKTIFYDEMKEPITVEDYMKGRTWNEIIASTAY